MRPTLLVAIAIFVTVTPATAQPSKVPIEQSVDQLVALFSDGVAVSYPKFRHIEFGKIFGSGRVDAIAIFNIEGFHGGNDHHQYLAFFESQEQDQVARRTSRPFRLIVVAQVGGRMSREFDWRKIKFGPGAVTLAGMKYGPEDAACCPSVSIQVTFRVKDGIISEAE